MRTDLIINGLVLLLVAFVLEILRGMVRGILDIAFLVVIIILIIIGVLRLIEGLIARPARRVPKAIHHIHHYKRPTQRKRR